MASSFACSSISFQPITPSYESSMSDLSDSSSDIEEMDLGSPDSSTYLRSPTKPFTPRPNCKRSWSQTTDTSGLESPSTPCPGPRTRTVKDTPAIENATSAIECLPREVLHEVGACLLSDQDLANLTLSCRKLAHSLSPKDAAAWKTRFLAKYDHPIIDSHHDFFYAYKIRRMILQNFVDFRNGQDPRLAMQLEVVKDIVLEAYHQPHDYLPGPTTSKNLMTLQVPGVSPWVIAFLSSPVFDYAKPKHGKDSIIGNFTIPQPLFDPLQLTLSYLLLSPASRLAHEVTAARDNYDIVRVYNWNQPATTILTRLPEHQQDPIEVPKKPCSSKTFPNLRSPTPETKPRKIKYELDLHTLLHIRNFWYRHLIDDSNNIDDKAVQVPITYAAMARDLVRLGHTPSQWDLPLQATQGSLQKVLKENWFGHYTCIQPWPKRSSDLAELQTLAQDWNGNVDPLTLDFVAMFDEPRGCTWPPIFNTIPAFVSSTPDTYSSPGQRFYIRGIAPFLDTKAALDQEMNHETHLGYTYNPTSRNNNKAHNPQVQDNKDKRQASSNSIKYHPYLSLRVRGHIHPLPAQSSIPGFHRILFILYKPTTHTLIQTLEHAIGDYGSPSNVAVTQHLLDLLTNDTVQAMMAGTIQVDPFEREKHLKAHLKTLLEEHEQFWPDGASMTKEGIAAMEDKRKEYLDWEDIEYAYAYEGVILPGGKIMLGRFWKVGEAGLGVGKEIDVEGLGVVVEAPGKEGVVEVEVGEVGQERVERSSSKGLDRGAFCFWS